MAVEVQTPRRSRRYQPLAGKSRYEDSDIEDGETVSWIGAPVLVRKGRRTDLHDEDVLPEAGEDDDVESETRFYGSFQKVVMVPVGNRRRKVAQDVVFNVGDTVLVQTQAKQPSVGVIVSLWEVRLREEGKVEKTYMKVKVHWFLRQEELPSVRARKDCEKNEVYLSLDGSAILTPSFILQHCTVSSRNQNGDSSTEHFCCKTAMNPQRGLYYELDWKKHADAAVAANDYEGDPWIVVPKEEAKPRKPVGSAKKRVSIEESDDEEDEEGSGDEYDESHEGGNEHLDSESDECPEPSDLSSGADDDDDDAIPRTPSKRKRKQDSHTTPKRARRTIAAPTPHSKAALRARKKRALDVRPLPAEQNLDFLSIDKHKLPDDPWLRAMQVLHVGSRPDALPCREDEFVKTLRSIENLLDEGSGGCVYISGVPGTGKTATVHRIVRELKRMAERSETNPFTYVEINGLKIPEPSAAYSLLWEAVSGHDVASDGHLKISAKEALKQLTKYFSAGVRAGPGGHACVVLMDELDQLLTTKQDVVYNFFNWPTLVQSRLVVIAVANTHDLPERVMSGRVRSRLGMVRMNFKPYTSAQLHTIVSSRLQSAKEGFDGVFPTVIDQGGMKLATMKVSSISGDARRVLDICRRAVELVQPHKRTANADDVTRVIRTMQNSPTAAYLEDCSLHEKIMLASLLKCVKRDGVEEIKWGDVQHQHLIYTNVLTGDNESTRKPSTSELRLVLDSLLASHAVLFEDGPAAQRKAEGDRKVILNIELNEVERVLSDTGGQHWKNALGV